MLSCEFCEISKNTFFTEHLQTSASAFSFSEAVTGGVLWKKLFLKISQNSQENTFGLRNFQKHLFYRTPLDDCFWLFRAILPKWDTANSVWKTSDECSLSRNTNLRSTVQVYHFFFQKDKLSGYVFINLHCLLRERAIRVKVFCKKGVLKDFVNFVGKHLCWSRFLIKFQAWQLFWRTSATDCFCTALALLLLIRLTLYSAPSSSPSLLLLLVSRMFVFGSNSKGLKEFKSCISFLLKSHFHSCYFLFPCFFCLRLFCFIFSCHCS